MSDRAASEQTPNAGRGNNTGRKVSVAVLALAGIVTMIALITTISDRNATNERNQQLQEQARPSTEPSSSTKFETVRVGMTVEQVEAIMGPAETVTDIDGVEHLQWTQQIKGGTLIFNVSVKDRKVSSKGLAIK